MYKVLLHGKKLSGFKFRTYELARSFVRKKIRKHKNYSTFWDTTNPNINAYGYKIVKSV